jgi:hypothetical protein
MYLNLNLKSYFAIIYLQNEHNRNNFELNLTILSSPDRSNLSIFDHPIKCPHEAQKIPRNNNFNFIS